MRTLQEKYNAILEGNFSKKQFVRDARLAHPNFITQFNGFDDAVTILKNKGMLREAKKQEVPEYDKPAPGVSLEAQERGIDYELQGMGINTGVTTPTPDQYNKAKEKAFKNLEKDPNHYLNLMSGDSKKVDKHDKYVEVKKNNHVDTFNGMKKAELKEGVGSLKEEVIDLISFLKKERGADNETIKDFLKMHFNDIRGASLEDILDEFDNYLSVNTDYVDENISKGIDMSSKDGYIAFIDNEDILATYSVEDAEEMARELAMNHHDAGQDQDNFVRSFMAAYKEGGYDRDDQVHEKKGKDLDGDGDIDGDDYMAAKDKAIKKAMGKKVNERVGALQDFISLIQDRAEDSGFSEEEEAEEVVYAIGDHYNFGVDILHGPKDEVNEGRRSKMKGGKVVTENDYETGGYVESMGPMLDRVLKQLIAVWDEWKEGPMTEPAMIPFAKKDLLGYIGSQITEGEDIVDEVSQEHEELKEAFKAIISRVLTEEVITEAATGNLSNIASKYDDYEGMQAAINTLENIVTDVESYYAKTKEKIQKVYDSFKDIRNAEGLAVGALIGPAIEDAFRKDLMPVTEKGFTKGLEMPKVKMLTPDDIQEEELEEKETVFKPVNENRKYKYTKKQK